MLQNNPELKSKIDQLWNKFWSGGISNPLTAIEQITYLLFMKRLDELDQKKQADAEWTGEKYTSKFSGIWIPPEHRDKVEKDQKPFAVEKHTLRWSEFKFYSPAKRMLEHVQNKVFPFLKDMKGTESTFTRHMKNAVFIIPKPALLVEAVKTIDEIFAIMEKDSQEKGQAFQDIQGDVYEMLLSEIATAGKNGQFRTPRHIIKLMANPPFTGSIDRGDINENLSLSTTKTELLFIENIYRLLKKGGTACVIVPQGVLFGAGKAFKNLRHLLVERCDLKAVITMPSGVFKPYAGVSTAILLFTKVWGPKDKISQPATEHVWFYEMAADGYSLDDKRTKQEGYGDLQDIVAKYHARNPEVDTDRTQKCFVVPRAEIEVEGFGYVVRGRTRTRY
jgi:type I restriction-modification system DNA methylase subunit